MKLGSLRRVQVPPRARFDVLDLGRVHLVLVVVLVLEDRLCSNHFDDEEENEDELAPQLDLFVLFLFR